MLNCSLPFCPNSRHCNKNVVKLHELPKDEELSKKWKEACPELESSKRKRLALCELHFASTCYSGKLKHLLKTGSVPSLFLKPESFHALPKKSEPMCAVIEHERLMKTVENLEEANAKLKDQLKSLKREVENNGKPYLSHTRDTLKKLLGESEMLGPTQIRCLVNGSTKGRGWTLKEKTIASQLKSMCNRKTYEYVRKNVVPLPSTSDLKAAPSNHVQHVIVAPDTIWDNPDNI